MISRRNFLNKTAGLGGLIALQSALPTWALSAKDNNMAGLQVLTGTEFDLTIDRTKIIIDGQQGNAISINGQVPAPLLRWREGDDITLRVKNNLEEDTSIHWHGILLPFQMDGVPGVTYPGIKPGQTFTYKFPVRQAGTYWYHSHSGLQEQSGHYGPIVIEPKDTDPVTYDREYIIVLSDWTFEKPENLFANLKKMSDLYNFQQATVGDFIADVKENGLASTIADRKMWGGMRMTPNDISDVTGATYRFLLNGHSAADDWTALYNPGERVRLRFINASAMSFFNVRIPGLPMTVVQADGLNVQPVETDEFQIGVAETYDVIIEPHHGMAFTLMCESIDRTGYVSATISPREGMKADIPDLREPPKLTMRDMGMAHEGGDHGSMNHDTMDMSTPGPKKADTMDHAAMGHTMPKQESKKPAVMDHAAMGHTMPKQEPKKPAVMDHAAMGHGTPKEANPMADMDMGPQEHNHKKGPGVANLAASPQNRMNEPGVGLENVSHRTLTYAQLKSLTQNPDLRPPERELEIHLTGNMERYMWSFDGVKFAEVKEPILFQEGERLRLTLVNDTMMPHPIHLHGMFFDVVNGEDSFKPRKHTIIVKPAEKLSVDVTADAVGDWAFHCHLIYHMHAGMMQVVSVREQNMGAM